MNNLKQLMINKNLKRCLQCIFSLILASNLSLAYANELTDGEIIAIYNQVNSFDIETAYIGQLFGKSESLRKLAQMVAADHTGVRQAAQVLANTISVTPVLPESRSSAFESHFKSVGVLRNLSGDKFDEAYLNHEIKFHTQALNAVKEVLLPAASSPELKAHFESALPHFEHHLLETKKVAKQLGY